MSNKTPEEMAEEFAFKFYLNEDSGYAMTMNRDAFLAGYKAAEKRHQKDIDFLESQLRQAQMTVMLLEARMGERR